LGSIMLLPIGAGLAFLMRADRSFPDPAAHLSAAVI
jgi:hypothetical protein